MYEPDKVKDTLENTLSAFIKASLVDLQKAFDAPDVTLNQKEWHEPYHSEMYPCEVCWGGSVMIGALNMPRSYNYLKGKYNNFNKNILRKLTALDSLRLSYVGMALKIFYIPGEIRRSKNLYTIGKYIENNLDLTQYTGTELNDPKEFNKFITTMTVISDTLEKEGL